MQIGQFKTSKFSKGENTELYLEIGANSDGSSKEIVLRTGDKLFIKDPQSHFEALVERANVDPVKAEQQLSRIPDFVKYILTASVKRG